MNENEFLIELEAKLDEAKSKWNINEDILTIAKAIESLKVQAEIDPNSVKNIANQLSKIMNQKIVVDNIQIDTKQFEKTSAKIGKSIGASINNNASSSINSIKHDIDSVMKEFKQNKLTGYDLSKMFNLNRSDVDNSVIQQVRNLTKELNSLAMEALKMDSDNAWEGIVNKLNSLSDVLNKFGLKRDTESFAESLDIADYFKNKKIFIGDKSEVLSNTGMGIRELNNQFRSLGVTFTTVSEGAIKLDTIWSELFNISPNLEKLVSFGDQLNGIVQHLKIAKEALYGESNLQPLDNGEVTTFLADWMGKLDDTFRKISLLKEMALDIQETAVQSSTESADTITKNEKKKQQAYGETAKAHAKLKSEMDDIVQKGDFKKSFSASDSVDDIKEYFKTLSATVSIKEKLDKGTGNEGFIVSLKNAVGVVEELRYKYNELNDTFEYVGGSVNDSGVKKQADVITAKAESLQIALEKAKASYSDMNSQNPIKEQSHISALEQQYNKVVNAINNVRSADNATFSSMVSNANKEKSVLDAMVTTFKKAENVSLDMKGNEFSSGLDIAKNKLEEFKAKAKDSPQITKTIAELDAAINKVSDPSSLYEFNDQLRVARAELAKIKSETSADNRNEKVGINISGLQSKIDDLRRISPEIDSFKAKIGNADVTVQTLYDDLHKINTQGDFSVINSKWRAFTDAAKAAGIAITEVEANSKKSIGWLGKLGDSFKGQMKSIGSNLLQTFSIASGFMMVTSKTKEAITDMENLDDILTEISKTSDLTSQELKDLGMSAYDSASKYGKTASDYLTGIKSMSQSGFYGEHGEAMAEQSLLAQAAGDMSAELADKYILASNAAYKLNGNAEKINDILDGQNMVCNRNSVAMADMAAGMSNAGTVASSYNVAIEDLTAMLGTMEAVTKSGGEEVGNATKSILVNLQNVNSDKITGTLKKANASMTEFINGAEKLRNPIDIIRDLAKTFNELDEDDPLRAEIITNVAGKYQASKFSALLQNMDMFDKMLVDYSEGSGSAMEEANKSAQNLSGSINSLSNSWNELVNAFVNTGEITSAVNLLNNLLQTVTNIVDKLGSFGTIGLGAGLFAGIKNTGKCRISVRIS